MTWGCWYTGNICIMEMLNETDIHQASRRDFGFWVFFSVLVWERDSKAIFRKEKSLYLTILWLLPGAICKCAIAYGTFIISVDIWASSLCLINFQPFVLLLIDLYLLSVIVNNIVIKIPPFDDLFPWPLSLIMQVNRLHI